MMRACRLFHLNAACASCCRRLGFRRNIWQRNSKDSFAVLAAKIASVGESFISNHSLSCPEKYSVKYNSSVISHKLLETPRPSFYCPIELRSLAASKSQLAFKDVLVDCGILNCKRGLEGASPRGVFFSDNGVSRCQRAGITLRCYWPCSVYLNNGFLLNEFAFKDVNTNPISALSSSRGYLNGAAPDLSLTEDQLGDSADTTHQKKADQGSLKLVAGSCYLPHPEKEKTGGEDAHFICEYEGIIGVADGVSEWADCGIDAGEYSRALMSNAVSSIREEFKGESIDPARILEKAHLATRFPGSSTACIIALTDQGIHAINLGDSGFLVIRAGSTVFRSRAQQYQFNIPYQLGSNSACNPPSCGEILRCPVQAGDVIVAGTDGLFDNLYNNEIKAIVVHATRVHLDPKVTAQKIAALARERALDRNRQTPYSAAAQEAGFRHYGGKLDDITVVVSYITSTINK